MTVIICEAVSIAAFTHGGCTMLAHLENTSKARLVEPTAYGTAGLSLEKMEDMVRQSGIRDQQSRIPATELQCWVSLERSQRDEDDGGRRWDAFWDD